MPQKQSKKDIAIEFLKENNPLIPSLTAARMICKKYPKIFGDAGDRYNIEKARDIIRQIRNTKGNQKNIPDTELSNIWAQRDISAINGIPESFYVKKQPFHFPKHLKKCLLMGDIHFPYHDEEALKTAISYGVEVGVDSVFLNGDILDCLQLSNHEKNPRAASFKMELEFTKEFLFSLRNHFPSQSIYFIPGNHENRIKRYLWQKGKEIHDLDELRLDKLLYLDAFDIKYLEHKSKVYWGKLLIEHGDKMLGSGGVNPARTLVLKFKRPTICNHFHRTSMANSKIYDGDTIMCWSVGCLTGLEADYMEVNEWNHGFAILEKDEEGMFMVHNKQIINRRVF